MTNPTDRLLLKILVFSGIPERLLFYFWTHLRLQPLCGQYQEKSFNGAD
jgi:hypothetical protein